MVRLPKTQQPQKNPLDDPLVSFNDEPKVGPDADNWTFRHAFEGTQVFGGTGSGKTSGSGRTLALAFLKSKYEGRYPFGGLVLTAKPEELSLWADPRPEKPEDLGYCPLVGRQPEVIVVGTDIERYRSWGIQTPYEGHSFNFLQYEFSRGKGGKFTQNLVSLFYTALESGQARGGSSADPYWEDALRQLLTNAVDLVGMAKGRLSLQDLTQVILTAPQTQAEAHSPEWQRGSFCWACLQEAEENERDPARVEDLRQTAEYWLLDFAGLADRTRSVIVSSFTSKATALLRSPMRQLFSAEKSTVTPDDTHRGKIVILDLSVKEYGEVGRFAQILFKTVWQRATERRDLKAFPNPVFLWADESQYFVTSEDMIFQQTARSKRAATVYMTQNISNYYAVLGGRSGNATTDSLLGNLQTKIFHANGDPSTNEWAERIFAKEKQRLVGEGIGMSGANFSTSEAMMPAVPAARFIPLKKGGGEPPVVQAIVFQAGRSWTRFGKDGKPVERPGVLVEFDQTLLRAREAR